MLRRQAVAQRRGGLACQNVDMGWILERTVVEHAVPIRGWPQLALIARIAKHASTRIDRSALRGCAAVIKRRETDARWGSNGSETGKIWHRSEARRKAVAQRHLNGVVAQPRASGQGTSNSSPRSFITRSDCDRPPAVAQAGSTGCFNGCRVRDGKHQDADGTPLTSPRLPPCSIRPEASCGFAASVEATEATPTTAVSAARIGRRPAARGPALPGPSAARASLRR